MKKGIHPEYVTCKVHCGCGNSWETRSTIPEIKIEVCSECHPFFKGGGDKVVDTLGRVDRFQKKFGGDYFSKAKQLSEAKKKGRRALRG